MQHPPALVVLNPEGLMTARRLGLSDARVFGLGARVEGADETFEQTAPALRRLFEEGHPIVGFCAAGILIRALAPILSDKRTEPPVVAVAADGSTVVPLLGGLTGGEDLACMIAAALNVRPASTAFGALDRPEHSSQPERCPYVGSLVVIGLGPGDAGWLTPEAKAALAQADDLVGYGPYLDFAPPGRPDQRRHASDNREEIARAAAALDLAREGRRVALVSSGDPGVFGMASALMEVLDTEPHRAEGIAISVLPGLSAMQAAAARVGAPLGHDFAVISLSDNLKPWALIEHRLAAAAEADLVLALYNPAGRMRREGLDRAKALLVAAKGPETLVVIARQVGRTDETVRLTTLGALDTEIVDMRTLLLVGSSQTRIVSLPDGRRFVYTPRRFPYGGG